MTETETLSAQDAAEALRGLEDYESRLSLKACALSWMLYGLAGAAIFATYGTIGGWFHDIGMPWLYAVAWMPWILGATLASNALWRMMNITFSRPETDGAAYGWIHSLVGSAIFLALGVAGYLLLDRAFGVAISTHVLMLFVVGLFTAVLATYQGRAFGSPRLVTPFVVAGILLMGLALVLGVLDLEETPAALIAAGADLTAYFAAALTVFRRG